MTLRYSAAAVVVALISVNAASARVTDEQVRQAIQRNIDALYALQNDRGTWDPPDPAAAGEAESAHVYGTNYGGTTALVTYALLTAGESYQSPRLRRAIDFLSKTEMNGTYAVGLRNHVWAHLPPPFEPMIRKDTRWLADAIGAGPFKGGYLYTPVPTPGAGGIDNSVTQYGVLGAWEGAKRGMPITDAYWKLVEAHFLGCQEQDGGWSYNGQTATTGSMTASGLACLFIVQDHLYRDLYRTPGKGAGANGAPDHPLHKAINRAVQWFDKNFSATINPGGGTAWLTYYLVGVERIGLASGLKYFGSHDWYAEGAEVLVRRPFNTPVDYAFSLIFLVRGRVPVFANKLRIPDYDWNNRPRDLNRLAQWVSDEIEQEMNWQIVDLSTRPEEWLDAPILYIAGHEPLKLWPESEQKLKRFIDLGGLVVTTADNGEPGFTQSVLHLYERLYPQYKLDRLPPNDELLGLVFPIRSNSLGALSLHNGVRHLAIHIPKDVSWPLHSASHADDTPWRFFTNLYYYATEKGQARPRLAEHYMPRRSGDSGGGAPTVRVGRIRYDGNWDPEPLAWQVQSNTMFNTGKADVTTTVMEFKDLPGSDVKLAHIVGTHPVTFSAEELAALKDYVSAGGVVLFENIGGLGKFTHSLTGALAEAFPGSPIRPLSIQSDLATGRAFGGTDVGRVDYRAYTVLRAGRFNSPRLHAITIEGEPRILISHEDLSVAMLNQPRWGIYGYSAPSAQKIMTNLVLWANHQSAKTPAAAE